MVSFPFPKIIRNIATQVEGFGLVESHLLDEGEHHIYAEADLQSLNLVIAFGKLKVEAGFSIEARTHDSLHDARIEGCATDDIVEVMFVGIVAHYLGEAGVVVDDLHIVWDAERHRWSRRQGVLDLHATPVGLGMQRALVAITAAQEEERVQLAIPTGAHALIEHVDGAYRLGMFVVHKLHLPKMFVVEIGRATVLEASPEAARIQEQFTVPFLEGHIVIILPHLLCAGTETGSDKQNCQKPFFHPAERRTAGHPVYSSGISCGW